MMTHLSPHLPSSHPIYSYSLHAPPVPFPCGLTPTFIFYTPSLHIPPNYSSVSIHSPFIALLHVFHTYSHRIPDLLTVTTT